MSALEVADIFRSQGPSWRQTHAGHISLDQLKVMSAIERCRSAQLGGHVLCCQDCGEIQIAYNSCRNRHCPKCQGSAAKRWLNARMDDLLPVDYYHVVFTLPAPIADITLGVLPDSPGCDGARSHCLLEQIRSTGTGRSCGLSTSVSRRLVVR